jgi:3-oxoacyl-[acyl-carrier protein] reductase
MLLENKNAVVYGAGGAIGGAVARAFAREGARLFLAGRTLDNVEAVAKEISDAGGMAESARVDALDEQAVEDHIADVAGKTDRIDVLCNAIGMEDIQGAPLLDMSFEDFAQPVAIATRTQFLTARAVAPAHGQARIRRDLDCDRGAHPQSQDRRIRRGLRGD